MSTFLTEINKPHVKPVILFEMDIGFSCGYWYPYHEAYTYYNQIDGDYSDIDDTGENFFSVGTETFPDISKIGSVVVGDNRLLQVFTPMECHQVEGSFFWDGSNRKIYIHLAAHLPPELFKVTLGESFGYRLYGSNSFSYKNSQIYDDRILSINNISKGRDSFYSGRLSFSSGSITLENSDGFFDSLIDDTNLYGASCRFYWGTENLDLVDFRKVFSGYVTGIDLDTSTITFQVTDEREKLSKNIVQHYFNNIDYPDLKEENVGKPIPIIYGAAKKVPIIMVNEGRATTKTGNYTGITCKLTTKDYGSIGGVTKIYVGDTAEYSTVSTKWSQSSTAGTISLSTKIYNPGKKVAADINGLLDENGDLIENGINIITDLLRKIYGIPLTNTFYNQAHVDTINGFKTAYVITENKSLNDALEDIAMSSRACFIVEDDGRYAIRVFSKNGASLQTLTKNDLLDFAKISYSIDESVTSLTIKYDPNFADNDYFHTLNDVTRESSIFSVIRKYKTGEFETFITDANDAQTYLEFLFDLYGAATKYIECKTFLNTMTREPGDIITIQAARGEMPNQQDMKCEVVNIDKNLTTGEISLKLRVFQQLGQYLLHQGIYYGDNASAAITNHSIVFGQNASNQIGNYSAVFGGTRRVSI